MRRVLGCIIWHVKRCECGETEGYWDLGFGPTVSVVVYVPVAEVVSCLVIVCTVWVVMKARVYAYRWCGWLCCCCAATASACSSSDIRSC